MTPNYSTGNRFLYLTTPLGQDTILLSGFSGTESISELFRFELELLADNRLFIPFDQLLGQAVSFGVNVLPNDAAYQRDFSGVCIRVSQGGRDQNFTRYTLTVVPRFWLLTQNFQSRIFQHISVPDILKQVLSGLDVEYHLQGGFEERDYCVQYQESDFHFAARLMEEEGIFYFFDFTPGSHKLILANAPAYHPEIKFDSTLIYEELSGGVRTEERISSWQKFQDLRSGKYTLWDHCFELPHKHLESQTTVIDSVPVGTVTHKMKVGGNEDLEIYEHPGLYAQRFDGIDRGGSPQAGEVQKIFVDNKRTVGIRMQQAENPMLLIEGSSNCRQLAGGHRFALTRHFNADGVYVIVSITHSAEEGDFRTDPNSVETHYGNHFSCIPFGLPFRPARKTPRPFIRGCQTAVVVGPAGEEIFTDQYGRVKVQFHWDRQGQYDANSSCWIRVGTAWAGRNWGWITTPRIGQEVIVDFLEGDPDQPIITNSVYNADMMPPYILPEHKTVSTWKSRSTLQGTPANYNELRYEDRIGQEQLYLHAERDKDERTKKESREWVGASRHMIVVEDQKELVDADKHQEIKGELHVEVVKDTHMHHKAKLLEHIDDDHERTIDGDDYVKIAKSTNIKIGKDHKEAIDGDMSLTVKGDRKESVEGSFSCAITGDSKSSVEGGQDLSVTGDQKTSIDGGQDLSVKGDQKTSVEGDVSLQIKGKRQIKIEDDWLSEGSQTIHIKAGTKLILEAGVQVSLKVGGNFVDIGPAGVTIQGTIVLINSGGAAGSAADADPDDPDDPDNPDDPDDPDDPPDEVISPKPPDTADDGSRFDKYNGPAAYGDDAGDGTGA
jgi:type VI secretion system secreted protein VgrG